MWYISAEQDCSPRFETSPVSSRIPMFSNNRQKSRHGWHCVGRGDRISDTANTLGNEGSLANRDPFCTDEEVQDLKIIATFQHSDILCLDATGSHLANYHTSVLPATRTWRTRGCRDRSSPDQRQTCACENRIRRISTETRRETSWMDDRGTTIMPVHI